MEINSENIQLTLAEKRIGKATKVSRVFVAAWIVASVIAATFSQNELFSRLGAVGVGLVLVGFSFLNSAIQNYLLQLNELHVRVLRTCFIVYDKSSKISRIIDRGVDVATSEDQEIVADNLAKIKLSKKSLNQTLDATSGQFSHWAKVESRETKLEVFLGVIATLQWGFGDWFLCWVYNGALPSC